MKIAVSGLGRMGNQIARKLLANNHEVIAHNRSRQPIDDAIKYNAIPAYSKQEVIDAFDSQKLILWIMVPAEVIDTELDEWFKILPQGSIVIDGGNSDFRLDKIRAEKAEKAGIHLLDIGMSGGIWGIENGFSMMIGGDENSYKTIVPMLNALSVPNGGYQFFNGHGSGHYVKMIHNAIEYGMMESIAEGYQMLKEGPYNIELAKAGEIWQKGSIISSWLNDMSRQITQENPNLENISGAVAESGEARWTIDLAKELNIPLPAIQAAYDVRIASQKGEINFATKLLAAMRNKFGGHDINGK